jgi:hypothetical protein
LVDFVDWEWRQGLAGTWISPQDFAVVDELLTLGRVGALQLSEKDRTALTDLRRFLRRYCDGEFELE